MLVFVLCLLVGSVVVLYVLVCLLFCVVGLGDACVLGILWVCFGRFEKYVVMLVWRLCWEWLARVCLVGGIVVMFGVMAGLVNVAGVGMMVVFGVGVVTRVVVVVVSACAALFCSSQPVVLAV